ncbi:hypothetical protein K469DRAFT_693869 [Zopfia rhizophila CBS 207.26]|uniref:Uncharacterized protein n=1 Tax=Zopfia rhizophila CBS 207.26 TaxID=1314779 RepID=A0A6A6DJD3_9PEZI|nr:hypothetical protein K469DRAFT_693869 [Zopfia rhizophila CBS 207.26]
MSLSAAVDGASGKNIKLIQRTPKRDKGPKLLMKKELLSLTPPGKSYNDHTYGIGSFYTTTAMAGSQLPLQIKAYQSYQYSPKKGPRTAGSPRRSIASGLGGPGHPELNSNGSEQGDTIVSTLIKEISTSAPSFSEITTHHSFATPTKSSPRILSWGIRTVNPPRTQAFPHKRKCVQEFAASNPSDDSTTLRLKK